MSHVHEVPVAASKPVVISSSWGTQAIEYGWASPTHNLPLLPLLTSLTGDDWVDWVGLSVYHFGATYPWGANTVPERNKFYNKVCEMNAAIHCTLVVT